MAAVAVAAVAMAAMVAAVVQLQRFLGLEMFIVCRMWCCFLLAFCCFNHLFGPLDFFLSFFWQIQGQSL